jgi:hypothetical protein
MIPSKNISPVGWYVASYLERFEFPDEDTSNEDRRCRAWENTIIVKAGDPEEAYQKAIEQATLSQDSEWTRVDGLKGGRLVFEGLTLLLPISDEIEDGAEILWRDYPNYKVKTIKKMIRSKEDLEAFSRE